MAYENLLGNWDTATYYDKRGKYMLKRVEDAFNDRKVGSALANAQTEDKAKRDLSKLRDDKPKKGEAVTLQRSTYEVNDSLLSAFDSIAQTDAKPTMVEGPDWSIPNGENPLMRAYENPAPANSTALNQLQSILGRKDGEYTSFTESKRTAPVLDEFGYQKYDPNTMRPMTQEVIDRVGNFSLNDEEKKKLKSMDARTLMDKFFGADTSKY